ncbi:O-antigen ligase family protein [Microbacterium sp. KSW2-21]|uniref:O-antigen ligase family protein n=2 Tax=Bacteria TaxID=2 RepID=A0ABU3RSB7_9MICO|nr:O-antigen ligase family protein [Microbacterium sp. KSW2-21]MDU0325766.1 O-antigen ligase family protein [Microbacterium sp. KSW2-21]
MSDVRAALAERLPPTLASKLMFIAVCAVPFQQALTIDAGFPLKISEITGILAVVLYMTSERTGERRRYFGAPLQWALLALVYLSTTLWLIMGPPRETALGYERGMNADMLLYFVYAALVIVLSSFAGTRLGPDWIARGLGVAVKLAAAWSLLQVALYFVGAASILREVHATVQIGAAYGVGLPRNGPFLEGNYLGFFAGIALFVVLRRRDWWGVAAAAGCLLYSQSTVALVGVVVGVLAVAVLRPAGRVVGVLAFVALVGIIVVSTVDVVAVYITRQLGKLGLISDASLGASIEYSLNNRTSSIQRAIDMSEVFPWLGVGPGRYGYWDDAFSDTAAAIGNRGIANNAYAQVLAEVGVVAVVCLIGLILTLILRNLRSPRSVLAMAVFLAVGLNAAPSWTVLPIWFAVALLATTPSAKAPQSDLLPEGALKGQALDAPSERGVAVTTP